MGQTFTCTWRQGALLVCLSVASAARLAAADRIELREEPTDMRIRSVAVELNVSGKVFPEPGPEKALKLAVEAHFDYTEPPAGRDGPRSAVAALDPPI